MKVITGVVLSTLTYVLISIFLMLVVHACLPGDVLPDGGPITGHGSLMLDLAVQAVACFVGGAVAVAHAQCSVRLATAAMGGAIFALVLASTVAFWSLVPDWYNEALIAMTLPFIALGAAWRRARPDTARTEQL
jgi:hypothetical protein